MGYSFSVPKSIRFFAFRQFEVLSFGVFPLFLGFKSPTFSRALQVTSCTIFFCVVSSPHSFQSTRFSHFQRSSPQFDRLVFQPLSQFRSFWVTRFQFRNPFAFSLFVSLRFFPLGFFLFF
ncbi:hypothetical protein AB406_2347 [Riemerella anatipestifer]|uniref:Transmembrane protein n=1 Tax=Riemerella anatipestifer TaxID=34085 RepID=A0A1S7DVZ0_RIEAN|nr:hypothetical protein AB406_0100 [Riemerella anatipestifer]AQY23276.1 hypothetical protein AB406_2347 [Riemerella anatipestifer]